MSRSKANLRFLRAITSLLGWPTRVRLARFSVPDFESIPFLKYKDLTTTSSHHWNPELEDIGAWYERHRVPFADPNYYRLREIGMNLLERNPSIVIYVANRKIHPLKTKVLYLFMLSNHRECYLKDLSLTP